MMIIFLYIMFDRREIFRIESDLRKHATVENRLLIPLVAKLEGENLH